MSSLLDDALILHGNYYRFKPGESVHRQLVHSRMQLWCHAGRGSVCVNQQTFQMQAGSLLILPWRHEITYKADRQNPFYVSGLHLIPYCKAPGEIPWFQVPNQDTHPLAGQRWIADRHITGYDNIVSAHLSHDHPLLHISAYVCDLFYRQPINQRSMRMATQHILHEWEELQKQPSPLPLPDALQRVCAYIEAHLNESLNLQDYARIAQCSSATLHRQCNQHLHCTLLQWQRQQQLQRAVMLLRSSTMRIGDISQQCGFNDALYFSRIFKQEFRMNPRAYRQRYGQM